MLPLGIRASVNKHQCPHALTVLLPGIRASVLPRQQLLHALHKGRDLPAKHVQAPGRTRALLGTRALPGADAPKVLMQTHEWA